MARIVPLDSVKFSLNKSENIFIGFNESLETEKLGIYCALFSLPPMECVS